jgi:curved DNA-binding protein CbpA
MTASHYDVLAVTETAADDEVRRAYRALALCNHPDKARAGGPQAVAAAAAKFYAIREAYDVLSDDVRRAVYDGELLQARRELHGDAVPSTLLSELPGAHEAPPTTEQAAATRDVWDSMFQISRDGQLRRRLAGSASRPASREASSPMKRPASRETSRDAIGVQTPQLPARQLVMRQQQLGAVADRRRPPPVSREGLRVPAAVPRRKEGDAEARARRRTMDIFFGEQQERSTLPAPVDFAPPPPVSAPLPPRATPKVAAGPSPSTAPLLRPLLSRRPETCNAGRGGARSAHNWQRHSAMPGDKPPARHALPLMLQKRDVHHTMSVRAGVARRHAELAGSRPATVQTRAPAFNL